MAPIVTSADIDRPADQVFAYATDPARFKEWQKGWWTGAWTARPTAPLLRRLARSA